MVYPATSFRMNAFYFAAVFLSTIAHCSDTKFKSETLSVSDSDNELARSQKWTHYKQDASQPTTTQVCFKIAAPQIVPQTFRQCKLMTTYQVNFPLRNHSAVARLLNTIPRDLEQISICHWSKVLNEFSEFQSVLSYASSEKNNEMWTGFGRNTVLFQRYSTYPPAKQDTIIGAWIHNCFTWSADKGLMKYYTNGEKIYESVGITAHKKIPPSGVFVLGQDGSRKPEWSFKGDVTEVHVWDYMLDNDQVVEVAKCNSSLEGNLISWTSSIRLQLESGATVSPLNLCTEN